MRLDTATYLYSVSGMCKFLRIDVLKRFLFPQAYWNWEWKCFWAEGVGTADSLLDWTPIPRCPANARHATPLQKNCHKLSRFPVQPQRVPLKESGAMKKDTFPCPFSLRREKQVERENYRPKFRPDALAFRKITNAKPSRPVQSNSRDDGSGVTPLISAARLGVESSS